MLRNSERLLNLFCVQKFIGLFPQRERPPLTFRYYRWLRRQKTKQKTEGDHAPFTLCRGSLLLLSTLLPAHTLLPFLSRVLAGVVLSHPVKLQNPVCKRADDLSQITHNAVGSSTLTRSQPYITLAPCERGGTIMPFAKPPPRVSRV